MANYLKTNTIGLDSVIHKAQIALYDNLSNLWGVNLDGYPRCYPINRQGIKTIEHFISNTEYKNLVYAETNKFFFTADNDIQNVRNDYFKTKLDLYFILNLAEISPSATHRTDEEVRNNVLDVLNTISELFIESIITNIDKVFSGFEYREIEDMHPYHCFKIRLNVLEYNINQITCN